MEKEWRKPERTFGLGGQSAAVAAIDFSLALVQMGCLASDLACVPIWPVPFLSPGGLLDADNLPRDVLPMCPPPPPNPLSPSCPLSQAAEAGQRRPICRGQLQGWPITITTKTVPGFIDLYFRLSSRTKSPNGLHLRRTLSDC